MGEEKRPCIALAGNPNTGKSTLFNALTGLKQHTGNWSGKTVGRAEGRFLLGGKEAVLVDLPGIYSLFSAGAEEACARDFLAFGDADAVAVVVDASALERHLPLALQAMELMPRCVLCLNLADEAETLSLKKVIEYHVEFLFEITTRKYNTLLSRELEKKEIQEGLIKACDVIDLIIEILRGSKNREQVKKCLVSGVTEGIRFRTKTGEKAASKLRFTENQATAILDMRLYRLIGLEMEALEAEYEKTMKNIERYQDILENYDSMAGVITKELDSIKKEYGTPRKTAIENGEEAVYEEKKMEEMEVCFLMDRFGYMKLIDRAAYERNKEAAHGENKFVFTCMNTDKICIFTDAGKMHTIKAADIPMGRFRDKGVPADNLSNYDSGAEQMLYVAPVSRIGQSRLLFVTEMSMCKLVDGAEFNVSKRTIASTKLAEGDKLIFVAPADEMEHVVLQSAGGSFLRFLKQEVASMKKTAVGVRGMKLAEGDKLEHAYLLEGHKEYSISYGNKEYPLHKVRLGKRDTKGIKPRI